jgi:ABC-type branched-subunit amino acid transport system permease subunit
MSGGAIVLGSITGLTYAILAVGLILIYRSNRFVNFAHGNLGALASVLFAKLAVDVGVPYWVALPIVLVGAGAVGALVELTIVRRLFDAPRIVLVVATIALSQLFFFFSLLEGVRPDRTRLVTEGFPVPFTASLQVFGVTLTGAHLAIIVFVPLLAAALTAFLRWSSWGQAIRASSENPDAARLAGISVKRTSTIVWVIAGVLAAATALLFAPLRPAFAIESMGPSFLVRALGAALVARMTSLPIAFGAAMALGIVEGIVFAQTSDGGLTDLVVFVLVLGALVVRGRQLARSIRDTRGGAAFGAETRPMPRELAASAAVQRVRRVAIAAAVALAIALPFLPVLGLSTSRTSFLLAITMAYALIGVSLTILTGWAGQVSLGHFALVGIGAFTVARLETAPVPIVIATAAVAAAGAAVVIGLPALRIQGLFLAVSTLAFGVVATGWMFQQTWMVRTPQGVFLTRPALLQTERSIYYLALVLLVIGLWVAHNIRRTATGRLMIAVRDNDAAARSAGVSAVWTRLVSFAISGALAGTAGVIFAYARQTLTPVDFPPASSLLVLLMVAVGGLGSLLGAVLGATFMFGIPALFGTGDLVTLFTSSVGVLIVLLYLPGGLASVAASIRDSLAARIVRREQGLPAPPRALPPLRDLWSTMRGVKA